MRKQTTSANSRKTNNYLNFVTISTKDIPQDMERLDQSGSVGDGSSYPTAKKQDPTHPLVVNDHSQDHPNLDLPTVVPDNKAPSNMSEDPYSGIIIKEEPRKVLVIYTGGTMGMKKENGSYKPVQRYLVEMMQMMPELQSEKMPSWSLIEYEPLLDSADMGHEDWVKIATDIEKNYYDYDGFVVIHGTDTMAYTASALSFMFDNLGKPVVFTGACTPIVEVVSDGRRNLIVSMLVAGYCEIPEVCVFFNSKLLRGNRTSKVDAWGLGAFSSGYFPPLATLGLQLRVNSKECLPQPKGRFRINKKFHPHCAVLRMIPGLSDDIVKNVLEKPTKGLIMQLYGVGTMPQRRASLVKILKDAIDRGVVIVCVTQCYSGTVDLDLYEAGSQLSKIGVIPGFDMSCEAAYTKLSHLLATGMNDENVKRWMMMNLKGELSKRTDSNLARSSGLWQTEDVILSHL